MINGMINGKDPAWLRFLERRFSWLAIPNIAILFVTLQAMGFIFVMMDPIWVGRLALIPQAVSVGEYWRVVTFLALPVSLSPLWVIFSLWFLYFILNLIENQWGAFKTTFYVLVSILLTIAYSFLFSLPILSVSHFQSTLFLAAAALFPEMEVRLFLAIPVKLKWMAWLNLAYLAYEFFQNDWVGRGYILAIYSNCVIFFGPAALSSIKQAYRRQKFKNSFRS